MRKMWKRITTTIIAFALMIAMIPMQALANDTKDTFADIPINTTDANGQNVEAGKASIKFNTMKYSSIDRANQNEYQIIMYSGPTKADLGPGGNLNFTIDDGYDYVGIYMVYITGVTSETFVNDTQGNAAVLTVPVPKGYLGNDAKRIFNWAKSGAAVEDYEKVAVTANADGTVSFPIVMGFVDWNNDGTGFGVYGTYVVEYKKPIDISALSSASTLSFTTAEYTGSPLTPTVTIPGLTENVDYTVAYANNTEVGTATVTITGIGKCTGTFTLNFTITAKPAIEEAKDDKGSDYKISTNGDTQEATYTAPKTKNETKITVPDEVTLPDGTTAKVTAIEKNAFKKNTKLTSATVGNNVKTIGDNAFNGCSKLTNLKLGNKVEKIGNGAVSNCKSLKKMTVPASTKTIGKNAFKGDSNLTTITINCKNLKSVGKDAIKNINPKATIKLKGSAKEKKAAEKLITNKKTGYKKSMKIKK